MKPGLPRLPQRFWAQWDSFEPEQRRVARRRLLNWPRDLWLEASDVPTLHLGLEEEFVPLHGSLLIRRGSAAIWPVLKKHDPALFARITGTEFLAQYAPDIAKHQAISHLQWLLENDVMRAGEELFTLMAREAAVNGWTKGLALLFQHGLTGHETNQKGRTLAHAAVYGEHIDVIRLLHEKGVDLMQKDHQGHDLFYTWALFCKKVGRDTRPLDAVLPWVKTLIELGLDPEKPTGKTPRSRSLMAWMSHETDSGKLTGRPTFWEDLFQFLSVKRTQEVLLGSLEARLSELPEVVPGRRRI